MAHGLNCSAACGIFPDQGANLCPLHWQADSQPLRHQGSPLAFLTGVASGFLLGALEAAFLGLAAFFGMATFLTSFVFLKATDLLGSSLLGSRKDPEAPTFWSA